MTSCAGLHVNGDRYVADCSSDVCCFRMAVRSLSWPTFFWYDGWLDLTEVMSGWYSTKLFYPLCNVMKWQVLSIASGLQVPEVCCSLHVILQHLCNTFEPVILFWLVLYLINNWKLMPICHEKWPHFATPRDTRFYFDFVCLILMYP